MLYLLWFIWFRRNKFLHENSYLNDDYWVQKSIDTAKLFVCVIGQATNEDRVVRSRNNQSIRWRKQAAGRVKINVDARISSQNWMGFGMIARDADDKVLCVWIKKVSFTTIPLIAEAYGLSFGLQVALQRGWYEVEVESDNLQLINLLSTNNIDRHEDGGDY